MKFLEQSSKAIKIKKSASTRVFNVSAYVFVSIVAVLCLIPFVMLVSGAFSSEAAIREYGYGLLPRDFSLDAFAAIFKTPETVFRAYGVTILVTVCGTFASLFLLSMTAYVLSRHDFKYRSALTFFFYFTTLFNGGMMSSYIFVVRYLQLKNNMLSLILPLLFNVFYLLILRNFMQAVPFSLLEAARIDGAGDFTIYIRIVLPLSKAVLANIGLFVALGYWNDWSNAMLYMADYRKWPLQYMLYNMLTTSDGLSRMSAASQSVNLADLPSQTIKLAMAVIAIGPIVVVYPFIQKFFVKGVTVGAVKG